MWNQWLFLFQLKDERSQHTKFKVSEAFLFIVGITEKP